MLVLSRDLPTICCGLPVFVRPKSAQNVVVVVAKQAEHGTDVVVLQHSAVVVHQRHLRANIVDTAPWSQWANGIFSGGEGWDANGGVAYHSRERVLE